MILKLPITERKKKKKKNIRMRNEENKKIFKNN